MAQGFITNLECSYCGLKADATQLHTVCSACGKVLLVRYDLDSARDVMTRATLKERCTSMWRYREVMPVQSDENIVTMGEGGTPLLHTPHLGAAMGLQNLYIKDEGLNPTGSFKARGLSSAVSRAKELGVTSVALPSSGNAAIAAATYCARGGLKATLFMPIDASETRKSLATLAGANVYIVKGHIGEAARVMRENRDENSWFELSTLEEPYRAEGKKTMGYELAEQMDWNLPDVIVYPTGGGTGFVGMWKAFHEMEALGWIDGKRPRMISVQTEGCAPIVRAYERGEEFAEPIQDARTIAGGLLVPGTIGDYLILKTIRESNGTAVTVADDDLIKAVREVGVQEGILCSLEGAATVAGLRVLMKRGLVEPKETILLFNTASALTTPKSLERDFSG